MARRQGDTAGGSSPRTGSLVLASAVILLGLFAYANAMSGDFVYDDLFAIRDNPNIRALRPYFTGGLWRDSRYLGNLSFALNFRWGGLATPGYHALNVAIHLASSLLVYAIVLLTFRSPRISGSALAPHGRAIGFVAAALFVAHPLQTQAVTYVVQRFTSLATFFCLASVALYATGRLALESGRGKGGRPAVLLVLALLSNVAAMRTKEIAIALPFAILLYEAFFFEGPWRRRLWFVAPFALTLPIIPWTYLGADPRPAPLDQPTPLGRADYLRTQIAVVVAYVRMLFVPTGQALDHHFPIARTLLSPRILASSAVLLLLAAAAITPLLATRDGRPSRLDPAVRMVSFGIAWFFLGLAPSSTFIPNSDLLVEHRVYLPSMGAAMAVATLLALVLRRVPRVDPSRAIVLTGLAASLLLATATMNRNEAWRSELTIWRDSAGKTPGTSRAHGNLGTLLMRAGEREAGLAELDQAVSLAPDWAWPRAQRGAALLQVGRFAESESDLRRALASSPADPEACFNLGMLLVRTGRGGEARPFLEKFLEVAPEGYGPARRAAEGYLARPR